MRDKEFAAFIKERDAIRAKREQGRPKPWTKDEILRHYRFCNVRREDDTVTKWIREHFREPFAGHEHMWFLCAVARFVNWPPTLTLLMQDGALFNENNGGTIKWNEGRFIKIVKGLKEQGLKTWSGAYIVSTNGRATDKAQYVASEVLSWAWKHRDLVAPTKGDTLSSFSERLLSLKGFKGFMAGQVIADAKYEDPILRKAEDWHTWAVSGPGSRRGMNRVLGEDLKTRLGEYRWHTHLTELRNKVNARLKMNLHAQDIQNCLCEFDKYERARLNQGRPRSTYPGV